MPRISQVYFAMAILYLMAGIAIGLHMSVSQDHGAVGAHAHVNLLGWVTSAVFGCYFALNPDKAVGWLPWMQFGAYATGLIVMLPSLYMMLAGRPQFEPAVAEGSMAVALGVVLFAVIVFTRGRAVRTGRDAAALVPAE